MSRIRNILTLLLLLFVSSAFATDKSSSDKIDVKKIIFEHVKDTYEWHITTVGEKHIAISLHVIIYSNRTGWELFSSSVFH